jgi:acylphosphatase
MDVHFKICIYGRVQRVGFRYHTKKTALQSGIRGFVRNQPDGSVYCEAEGSADAVAQFISWCHTGSPWAQVERVITTEGNVQGFASFEILNGWA